MKIGWDSEYTNFTWGVECDYCHCTDDPEGHNMSWWMVTQPMGGEYDFCSLECLRLHDYRQRPREESGKVGPIKRHGKDCPNPTRKT